jgi:gamma-glutamylcyclotransferase (GGCT)/AIG2-like uncharacterized protein YtfP
MSEMTIRMFVYGTLKTGYPNERHREHRQVRVLSDPATVAGTLYLGCGAPVVVPATWVGKSEVPLCCSPFPLGEFLRTLEWFGRDVPPMTAPGTGVVHGELLTATGSTEALAMWLARVDALEAGGMPQWGLWQRGLVVATTATGERVLAITYGTTPATAASLGLRAEPTGTWVWPPWAT